MCVHACKRACVRAFVRTCVHACERTSELITRLRNANISIYRDVTKCTFLAKKLFNLAGLPYRLDTPVENFEIDSYNCNCFIYNVRASNDVVNNL